MVSNEIVKMLAKIVIISVFSLVLTEKVRYDNYALYKVHPGSEDEVDFLKDLNKNDNDLNFWVPPSQPGQFVSVVTPPGKREEFEHVLSKRSIFSELMLSNIQEAFEEQHYSRRRRSTRQQLSWANFQTLEEIYHWFEYLASEYPDVVTLIAAGASFEGRNITGIKISRSTSRRVFFLGGGQIGADWLSPALLTYIADQLVKGEDPNALAATQEFEWHIVPVINPDGFQFTQDSDRLWIKNRRPIQRGNTWEGIGVDLTKNWNSQWGVSGGSYNASYNNFIGLGPFSEPETRTVAAYVQTIGPRLTGFLHFRGFGQRMVIPFAHATTPMYNYNEMVTIGRRAAGSLAVRYNTQYLVGMSRAVFDGATGQIEDWAKYRWNPPIAATYYLRDTGAWGYTFPIVWIIPTCEETFDSLMAILREAKYINVL